MSSATLFAFKYNEVVAEKNLRNSWGFIPYIWKSCWNRHFKDHSNLYEDYLEPKNMDKLCTLPKLQAEVFIKVVLVSTFDYALIYQKDYKQYCDCLKEFIRFFPVPVDHINHFPAVIEFVTNNGSNSDKIGFRCTSVSENPWLVYDHKKEDEDGRPYNFNLDDKHFDVFKYVEQCNII